MTYLGDFIPGDVIDLKFTTVNTAGVPTTLAGSPAISVYKNNSDAESTAGVSLSADFDSRTGLNHVRITTASDGTFYSAGADFQIVITTGTVGGSSVVGYVVAHFSITRRYGIAHVLHTLDWTTLPAAAARSTLNALRFIRNKWGISGTTLSVKKEDDSTNAWTATITTDPSAQHITGKTPN